MFITIALDAMPFITRHYDTLTSLDIPWRWFVVEGVAANANCTSWCSPIAPRLSEDGTTQYLNSLRHDSRVCVLRREWWSGGKVEMVNEPLKWLFSPCLLWQMDADEVWTKEQIERGTALFEAKKAGSAMFYCRYFVGPDIVLTGKGKYGNRHEFEWRRLFRWEPGVRWASHEPPKLDKDLGPELPHSATEAAGLVFDHYAYVTEAQVGFKAAYYSDRYRNAVTQWRQLQQNRKWPVRARDYLKWIEDDAMAERIAT